MTAAAWLLIVTGIYTGSMAPGVEVRVSFEAPARSERHCGDMAYDFKRKLQQLGATDVEARCRER